MEGRRLGRAAAGWMLGAALAGVLLGTGAARAQSAGTVIAGPFTVTLPSTKLFAFSTSFNVPPPIAQSYVVRVSLSAPNSLTTISFKLNNTQVLSLSDFTGGVTSVDRVVTLVLSNTIALQVAGVTGTKITVTVFTVVMPKPVSLAPDPLALTAGTSGTLTSTLSPTPTAAGTLNVTSGNAAVAAVPSSVAFAAGQAKVSIPVTALAVGNAVITASANGGQASATVNVTPPPPPVISGQSPKDVTLPGGSTPQISAQYSGVGSSIDVNKVKLLLDGLDVTSQATVTESAIAYQVTQPLSDATHTVTLTVVDLAGTTTTQTWSFLVDDPAPNFYGETPRDVFVADRNPRIRVLLSGFNIVLSSIRITLDGNDVTAQANVATDRIVFIPVNPLGDGTHVVSVVATDGRGVTAGKQWSFTVELPPPPSTTEDGVRTNRTVVPEIKVLP